MKKEVIIVPKDKSPMDVLAEMGEQTRNAWIFLCADAVEALELTCDSISAVDYETVRWRATSEYPATAIAFERNGKVWSKVYEINASDIAFKTEPSDPENIFFIKMG